MRPYAGVFASSVHPPTVVTGGVASTDALYNYRTFTASDTLSISGGELNNAEILVIAGGGQWSPGVWQWFNSRYIGGGGGGAGGVINTSGVNLSAGDYPVVIGAAGGNNTEFYGFVAIGGGYGNGSSGGSGGGGDALGQGGDAGGQGVAGQGSRGGDSYRYYATYAGGGGGGYSGVGGYGGDYGGNGGNGIYLPDWASATNTGVSGGWYAGGGFGAGSNPGLGAAGGPNNGGGGSRFTIDASSGIFIIRWAKE